MWGGALGRDLPRLPSSPARPTAQPSAQRLGDHWQRRPRPSLQPLPAAPFRAMPYRSAALLPARFAMTAPLPPGCRERTIATATLQQQHLVESGDPTAPLVVLLHGFPEFWYSWRHQLSALSAAFHVVAPDLRGYGGTEKPAVGYDMLTLAGDVDALLQVLTSNDSARRPVTLVGHDWGGVVAWATATLHPERIDKLVAIDAPHPLAYLHGLLRHPGQLLRSWYIAMFQVAGLFEWQYYRHPYAMMARMLRGSAVQRDVFPRQEI